MNKAIKTVSFIAVVTMLAKILGLWRDVALGGIYGTGVQSDAYVIASRIPLLFFDFTLGAAIVSTFIPVFNKYLQHGKDGKARDFANNFISIVFVIAAAFCVIGMLFHRQLTAVMAPGSSAETKELAARLLLVMLPTIILTTLAYSFVGLLQSYGNFGVPAIISLVSNAAIIVYLYCFNSRFGIYGLAFAMLIGWSLQVFVQIPSLVKLKFRYRPRLNLKDEGIRDVFVLALPILISSWIQPICVLINTIFASFMQEGTVTSLEYANRLYIIIVGVFAFAITNYVFPALSKFSAGSDTTEFSGVMKKSVQGMTALVAPIMAGMILLSKEITTLTYMRGKFDESSVALTSTALMFYAAGMIFYGTNEVLNKCFYAMEDGKTPMYSSVLGITSTLIFTPLFSYVFHMGIGGLALSVSLSTLVISINLIIQMQKKFPDFTDRGMRIFLLEITAAVLVMSAAVYAVKLLTAQYGVLAMTALSTLAGAAVYMLMAYLLKMDRYIRNTTERADSVL